MKETTKEVIEYSVPAEWGKGVYKDKKECCSAARPFTLLHEKKTEECWIIIHGYRGYPGEFIRPAEDLFEAGFDVYVPRLPGHGTCGKDFTQTHMKDWMGLAANAVEWLKKKYSKVNLLGHSMGTAMAAVIGSKDEKIGKIIYVCPSFENLQMPFPARLVLAILSPIVPKVKCKWHTSSKYHLHYENAPCDELYLGKEYWQYYFTKQLLEYYLIMKSGLKAVGDYPHEHLVVFPGNDHVISEPSVELYKKAVGDRANVLKIENGTHSIFYDKDPEAEEQAVRAVVEFARS